MYTPKTSYTDELQRCADEVSRGRTGSILNNPKLFHDYNSDMLDAIWHAIEQGDDCVKTELILLLANLKVESVAGSIDELVGVSSPEVVAACNAYRNMIGGSMRKADRSDVTEPSAGADVVSRTVPPVRESEPSRPQTIKNSSYERDASYMGVLLRMLMVRNPHLDVDDEM